MDVTSIVNEVTRTIGENAQAIGTGAARASVTELYRIISNRFRTAGEESTLDELRQQPTNDSLFRRQLREMLTADESLARSLESALTRVTRDRAVAHGPTVRAGRDVVGTVAQGSVAQGQGNVAGDGNVVGNTSTSNRTVSFGGVVAVVAVIVVVLIFVVVGVRKLTQAGELTASSTCAEFLQASEQDQLEAIRSIGLQEHVAGIGSPLALPAIQYSCGGQPDRTLGGVVAQFDG